ncbi:MAG: hypothetical protein ABSB42_04205 [Tepidisphaeraceae bacterium]|jgi:hypothetical protein
MLKKISGGQPEIAGAVVLLRFCERMNREGAKNAKGREAERGCVMS